MNNYILSENKNLASLTTFILKGFGADLPLFKKYFVGHASFSVINQMLGIKKEFVTKMYRSHLLH